jgi:hypothetical protein
MKKNPCFDQLGRDVPLLYRGVAEDARRSRAAAVKLFCLECVGYVRKDVTECSAHCCPLHPHRPYQNGEEDDVTPENSGTNDSRTRAKRTGGTSTPAAEQNSLDSRKGRGKLAVYAEAKR